MKKTKKIILLLIVIVLACSVNIVNANEELQASGDVRTDFTVEESIKRSSYNALQADNSLEKKYNLKDNINIRVKDQKNSGSCWAFSFSTLVETSLAKKYNRQATEVSPMHIEYITSRMFNRALGSGAGPRLSVAYAAEHYGPIAENDMPFSSVYTDETGFKSASQVGNIDNFSKVAEIKDTREFSSIYKGYRQGKLTYYNDIASGIPISSSTVETQRKLVKEHIKKYGAISADIYMNTSYYNSGTYGYCYNDYNKSESPNHDVVIVGWNDDYPINNFKESHRPSSPGAYIALNSYGSSWGDGGYMYISYEDEWVETGLVGITNIETYDNSKEVKVARYDELGMNMGVPLQGKSLYAACKFNTDKSTSGGDVYVDKVGLYIAGTSGVEVYVNPNDDDISKTELVAAPAEALEAGYHIIEFNSPVKLTGNKFAVKVKYTNATTTYIPLEVNYKEFGLEEDKAHFFDGATANDNESFISVNDTEWNDVNKTSIRTQDGISHSLKNSSACIKSFFSYTGGQSQPTAPPTTQPSTVKLQKIEFKESTANAKIGDRITLTLVYTPQNATNKKVRWESSDDSIATVSDTGIITAISEGTVTIKAISEDGNLEASCTIKVSENTAGSDEEIYRPLGSGTYYSGVAYSGSVSNKGNKDGTLASISLPAAGKTAIIIISAITIVAVAIISFIRIKKMKDIK